MGILFAVFFLLTLGLIITHRFWAKLENPFRLIFLIGMGVSFAATLAFGLLFANSKYFPDEKQWALLSFSFLSLCLFFPGVYVLLPEEKKTLKTVMMALFFLVAIAALAFLITLSVPVIRNGIATSSSSI